jgi:hypothetical protein
MLCDMSHITCGKFFRFEVAKLPPQMRRQPAQGLADANPTYVRTYAGLAWPGQGRAWLAKGQGRSPARAKPRRAAKPHHSRVGATRAWGLPTRP